MSQLSEQEQAMLEKSHRLESEGWIYVHLEGSPYEIGFQHGYRLANEMKEAFRVNDFFVRWETGNEPEYFASAAERLFQGKIADEYLEELKGIVDGAIKGGFDEIDLNSLLAWNGMEELLYSWWPLELASQSGKLLGTRRRGRCSAFIATGRATCDGEIVMAHNSWCPYATGAAMNVILDIHPETGHRIFMQSLPGHIDSNTDFFITGAGIMGLETTIDDLVGYDESKLPEFYRARKAMQEANDVRDWMDIMIEGNNGGYGNTWLLGEVGTGEITQFDLGVRFFGSRSTKSGFYGGFNVAHDLKVRDQEGNDASSYYNIRDNGARRLRWNQLIGDEQQPGIHFGKIDSDIAKSMIADHGDTYLAQLNDSKFEDNPSSRTICGHIELDSAEYGTHAGAGPYYPWGANDAKVMTSAMASELSFLARWGHPCGRSFDVTEFLQAHPQYEWQSGYLKDRKGYPWTAFRSNQH